jgi:hypothetical protein
MTALLCPAPMSTRVSFGSGAIVVERICLLAHTKVLVIISDSTISHMTIRGLSLLTYHHGIDSLVGRVEIPHFYPSPVKAFTLGGCYEEVADSFWKLGLVDVRLYLPLADDRMLVEEQYLCFLKARLPVLCQREPLLDRGQEGCPDYYSNRNPIAAGLK